MLCLELIESLENEGLAHRHHTTVDEAVIKCIGKVDLVRRHDLLHKEGAAEALCVIMLNVIWMTCCLNCVVQLGVCCNCHECHCCK